MDKRRTANVLREMLWEIAKGFDVIYRRARRQVQASPGGTEIPPGPHRMEPHPGLTYLLEKLEVETSARVGEVGRR